VDEKAAIDVLRHLEGGLRSSGLADLAMRLAGSDLPADPRSRLLRYLEVLESELQAGSERSAGRVLQRLQAVARTEDGGRIEGIEIELSPAERDLYDVDLLELVGDHGLGRLAGEVHALRNDLVASFAEDGWG
jgi:hypothetical protein